MQEKIHFSFTPSLMDAESLETLFVQREDLAARIIDLIQDSAVTEAKYHFLLVGPRGIGKTHMVSLIYHRVKALADIREKLLIAWLREDSWGIASFLDLLVQVLQSICKEYNDEALRLRTEDIFRHPPKLAERVAAELLKEYVGKRTLLLIVENLDGLFAGLGDSGQKRLRAYLQENPFCTILATSPSLFNGVSLQTSPFYGFFTTHHLMEFDFDHAHDFLTRIAGYRKDTKLTRFLRTPQGRARVRAVHHLAGGNPRVYTIFAQFLNRSSLEKLVEPFMRAMDDLTPYYQARMSLLSPQQRKIVELLCDQRGAITVKAISKRCFISHQTASGQLKQLREMRYVSATVIGRESYYELSEPLMRICLEVKKHRGEPLRLFVDFLRCWYTKPELESLLEMIPLEAKIESKYIQEALTITKDESDDPRILSCYKDLERYKQMEEYDKSLEVLDELDALKKVTYSDLLLRGDIYSKQDQHEKAIKIFKQAIALDGTQWFAWLCISFNYLLLKQYEDGLHASDEAIKLGADFDAVWKLRGICLHELGQHEQAVHSLEKELKQDSSNAGGWAYMGKSLMELGRFAEAGEAFSKVYELDKSKEEYLIFLYLALVGAGDLQKTVEFGKKYGVALANNPQCLGIHAAMMSLLGRDVEALSYWQQVIEAGDCPLFIHLGRVGSLIALQRWDDVDAALNEALTNYSDVKSPQELEANLIITKLFTTKQEPDIWHKGSNLLISHFAHHEMLSFLASGLVRIIPMVIRKTVSDATATLWCDVWTREASDYSEMELALRLLDTAIKYRAENDQRLLMELPVEERKILEEVFKNSVLT